MDGKITFNVFDSDGNDVTHENTWFIDSAGNLFYLIEDIDNPVCDAENDGYTYKVISEIAVR